MPASPTSGRRPPDPALPGSGGPDPAKPQQAGPDGTRLEPPTLYSLLQLTPAASRDDLRQAFRSLSKRYHPDTTSLPAPEAEQAFRRLQHAYAVLSDPQARQRYDAQLRQTQTPSAALPVRPAPARPLERPQDWRRTLSGGEWLALLLLGLALLFSLVLGVGLAWIRGAQLVQPPSWWPPAPPLV